MPINLLDLNLRDFTKIITVKKYCRGTIIFTTLTHELIEASSSSKSRPTGKWSGKPGFRHPVTRALPNVLFFKSQASKEFEFHGSFSYQLFNIKFV